MDRWTHVGEGSPRAGGHSPEHLKDLPKTERKQSTVCKTSVPKHMPMGPFPKRVGEGTPGATNSQLAGGIYE